MNKCLANRSMINRPSIIIDHPDFYVVNKPAKWLSHINKGGTDTPDVLSYCRHAWDEPELTLPHRLDRETSGVQIICRDKQSSSQFFEMFKLRLVGKSYLAIVHGVPKWQKYSLSAALGPWGLGAQNQILLRQAVVPNGKPAVTNFRLLEVRGKHSLIAASPETGRMHQIRAHLYHLGLPIVGDKIYGSDPQAYLDFIKHGQTPALTDRLGLERQALHARRLAFAWSGAQVVAEAPMSSDMQAYWESC